MQNDASYPEAVFEQRLARYTRRSRTKLPFQVELETCQRVQRALLPEVAFLGDLLLPRRDNASGEPALLPLDLCDGDVCHDVLTGRVLLQGRVGTAVLDRRLCVVDTVRQLLDGFQKESCGACTFCRVGTQRMREILERICSGQGRLDDFDMIQDLAEKISTASLCEVGKLAAKPVRALSCILRDAFEAHIHYGSCRTGSCSCENNECP